MPNFIETYKRGQRGEARGIPFGEGLESLTKDLNGIHRGRMYGIAGPEKSGKTTMTDYAFVIQPYLFAIENNIPISWVYYSFEIDRVSKEFDFITYFLHKDFGIETIQLDEGITKDGKNTIPLSPDYLRGYIMDDKGDPILVKETVEEALKEVYIKRIIPLFGEFDKNGNLMEGKEGLIDFREGRQNPTGIYKDLIKVAEKEGQLTRDQFGNLLQYVPDNPKAFKIVVVDHKLMWLKIEISFEK